MRLVALLLTLAAPPALAQVEWAPLPAALEAAEAQDRPALVYVQAAWCGPCRRLERETFADPAVQDRLRRFTRARLTVDDRDRQHRVDAWRLSEAEWAAHYGAEATPTLVFLAPDGTVLGRQFGFLPSSGLLPILDTALAAAAPAPPEGETRR
ncbi:thioredoxin family protein [Rubrivirga sp. S365]|uniref:thioredoxin family protein n=1 Tax=Rubrivirga sp. S365 TaxID=3076080 RepID=UPI0028C9DF06|nr:thioredoxin family protein [Rubrivirga sp. S365]MDT7856257.1 thioredoxin family protein [Rubrivirga sp. S365]